MTAFFTIKDIVTMRISRNVTWGDSTYLWKLVEQNTNLVKHMPTVHCTQLVVGNTIKIVITLIELHEGCRLTGVTIHIIY